MNVRKFRSGAIFAICVVMVLFTVLVAMAAYDSDEPAQAVTQEFPVAVDAVLSSVHVADDVMVVMGDRDVLMQVSMAELVTYQQSAPQWNTLIREQNGVSLFALADGNFQVNGLIDNAGDTRVIVLDGATLETLYSYAYQLSDS